VEAHQSAKDPANAAWLALQHGTLAAGREDGCQGCGRRTGRPRGDGTISLAEVQTWGKERTVRAAVLQYLLVAEQWPAHARGVRLRGVRISGHLDLEAATLRCQLSLERCYFDSDEPACLDYARALRVILTRCRLAGLKGEMLTAEELNLSFSTLTGPLSLSRVRAFRLQVRRAPRLGVLGAAELEGDHDL
jgi:hypothetical protein